MLTSAPRNLPVSSSPSVSIFPPHFCHDEHRARCLAQLRSKTTGLEKYIYLSSLKGRDPHLFYDLVLQNMMETVQVLYTPTVGDACLNYSHIWRRPEGLYVSLEHRGRIKEVLKGWPLPSAARIAVVTDGSRILGLGDLGANGLPIALGKLDLYIACAGLRPASTVPICLDLGTNTKRFLEDPLYLGIKQERPSGPVMDEFMDEFMDAMKSTFPDLLVQFEDFSTDNAFKYLDVFRSKYRVFNDDIQGTGAVVLSGFINAAKLASAASGLPIGEHKILFFGAGSAGIGVAKQLMAFFTLNGVSAEDARSRIYTVDSKGLITADRKGLQEHKKFFARTDYIGQPLTNLLDIVKYVKPTALVGLSTIHGAFTEEVVRELASLNTLPIIFPLSNPLTMCELDFEPALKWTNGTVLFASGSPYSPVEYEGGKREAGQGNNMYIFPGVGLGTVLCRARHVSDAMVEAASVALASSLSADETKNGLLYPRLPRIRQISAEVAFAVIRKAQSEGLDENTHLRALSDNHLMGYIHGKMFVPQKGPKSRI